MRTPIRALTRPAVAIVAALTVAAAGGAAQAQDDYITTPFQRRVVDLEQLAGLLRRVGAELPFDVAGQVAVEGSIGYPRGALLTPRLYRIEAVLTAERLVIEGLVMRDVRAELLHQDGVARLRELSFLVPHGAGPPGRVTGSAILPLSPPGDLATNLQISQLPIERLLELLPELEGMAEGLISGEVRGQVNPARLNDVTAWRLTGGVNLEAAEIADLPPIAATTRFEAADGVLTMSQLRGRMGTAEFAGSGRATLTSPYQFIADVQLSDEQLTWLDELPEAYRPPFPVAGALRLKGAARGQLDPLQWRLEGEAAGERLDFGETEIAALAGDFTAQSPADGADSLWSIRGAFRLGDLRAGGLLANSLQADFVIDDERIDAANLAAVLYGGSVRGSASFPMAEPGDAQLELRMQGVDLGRLLADMNVLEAPLAGEAEGVVDLAIPVDDPDDVDRWRGVGRLTLSDVAALGLSRGAALAEFQIDRGRLLLSEVTATKGAMRLRLSGSVGLRSPHSYAIVAEGSQFEIARLNLLPPPVRPPAELAGVADFRLEGSGQLAPISFVGRGEGNVAELRVDDVTAEMVSLAFNAGEEQIQIARLDASLYGGELHGEGLWPRTDASPAEVELHWRDVNLGRLLDDAMSLPVSLEGVSDGDIAASAPPGAVNDFRRWSIDADVAAEEILINGVLAGAFAAQAQRREDVLTYRLEASLLDGQLQAEGSMPMSEAAPEAGGGTLTLTDVRFARLAAIFQGRWGETGLDGVLDLHAAFEHDAESLLPSGSGVFSLRRVELAGFTQVEQLEGRVLFTPAYLRFEDVSGGLSGGRIQATATLRLEERPTGEFLLNLRGAEANRFLGIWLGADVPLTGRLDLSLRGRLADSLRVAGNGRISRAEAGVLSLGSVR
ncbi:MAG: AsmA family protein, partial [Planctomycetes bacterium]|nr:AsmA family protein [Planctomycetota bacterium]